MWVPRNRVLVTLNPPDENTTFIYYLQNQTAIVLVTHWWSFLHKRNRYCHTIYYDICQMKIVWTVLMKTWSLGETSVLCVHFLPEYGNGFHKIIKYVERIHMRTNISSRIKWLISDSCSPIIWYFKHDMTTICNLIMTENIFVPKYFCLLWTPINLNVSVGSI